MKTTLFKTLMLLLLCAFFTAFTAGCSNTMKGMGEDIENAGDKIEDATDEAAD